MASAVVGIFDFERKTVMSNSGYEMPIMDLGTYSRLQIPKRRFNMRSTN